MILNSLFLFLNLLSNKPNPKFNFYSSSKDMIVGLVKENPKSNPSSTLRGVNFWDCFVLLRCYKIHLQKVGFNYCFTFINTSSCMITVLIHLAQGLTQPVVTNFAVHCSNHPRWVVLIYADRFSRDAINKCGEAILLCMVQITLGELC